MDVLNVEDKGESVAKGDVEEEEEVGKEKDDKNGDEEAREEGTGRISRARMLPRRSLGCERFNCCFPQRNQLARSSRKAAPLPTSATSAACRGRCTTSPMRRSSSRRGWTPSLG